MTAWLVIAFAACAAAEPPDFERDIAPILVQHCLDCHQINKRSGGLDLTTIDGLMKGGESGPAIVREKPSDSLLIERVASGEMPPPETKGARKLSAAEVERLKAWIAAGAAWPKDRELGLHEKTLDLEQAKQFWSFRKVVRPSLPNGDSDHPLDAFIRERLNSAGLTLSPPASRRDVLRRVALDVTGLPPSPDEQERFLADTSPDAYERLIDRLLADPGHGERWARHWLDLVRYADSNGYERDAEKPSVFHYRDYVIRALNADKPYDAFVREQLAGDELPQPTFDTLAATGFHMLGTWQDEVDPLEAAQYRADELDDMIRTTSQTFLGVTLGCARCHQHKFDPFTMVDYYSLAAVLAPLKRPNAGRIDRDLPIGTPDEIRAENERNAAIQKLEQRIQDTLKEHKDKPDLAKPKVDELRGEQRRLKLERPDLPRVYRGSEDSPTAAPTPLLKSGRASNPGPVMQPLVPAVLTEQQPIFSPGERSTLRRRTFADWVASADNPLTARVIVNRVWQHHFGVGLVATSSDFGEMGTRPTHPELLDWLADWFAHDAEWSLKKLHRLILTSDVYRQSSAWNDAAAKVDPENKLLWRYPFRRLDAEAIRDATLAVSGELNRKAYGPAVYLPIPDAIIEAHTDKHDAWKKSPPEETSRRTIYAFVKRTLMVPMLETFDFCDTTQSTERRSITSVATQALTLYNGRFVTEQAERFAGRLEREAGDDVAAQIDTAYRLAFCRPPTPDEQTALQKFLADETTKRTTESSTSAAEAKHRALVQLCRAVLNLNEFVYPN